MVENESENRTRVDGGGVYSSSAQSQPEISVSTALKISRESTNSTAEEEPFRLVVGSES